MSTVRALDPTTLTLFVKTGHSAPSARQLTEAGVNPDDVSPVGIGGFARALSERDIDIAVIALGGDGCQAVLHALAAREWPRGRPLTVTGYVGIVYQGFIEGVLLRGGSDIILANSPQDAALFRSTFTQQGLDPAVIVEAPLPFLKSSSGPPPTPFTLTFAAQPEVPASRGEREYLVRRLATHARLFPDRRVLLKVRGLPGEQLTHPEPYPYHRLLARLGPDRPANLELVAGPMSAALARTSLLVTVSSTAAAESIHRGIPTAILTDFGIRESLGNPYFAGSGCFASFDEIDAGAAPSARADWARANGLTERSQAGLRSRVDELLSRPRGSLTPYLTLTRSPYYLPRLLASHGLAPDGTPLADPGAESRLRRGIRTVSHLLYRKGANVVAPALRRLGSA